VKDPAHVVWDWNGTLLDDFGLTAEIAGRTLAALGVEGVTGEDIRTHFRRPFGAFYASLFGRPVSVDEFRYIRDRYQLEYEAQHLELRLQSDALAAMDLLAERDATQSLLSMAPDPQLQALVDHHHLRGRFQLVEGSPEHDSDGNKAVHLARHLAALRVEPAAAFVIGDTVDDHEAAVASGAGSVLVTTGSTSRASLEATGAPVVETLLDAAMIVIRGE